VIEREVNEAVLLFEPRVQLNDANTFIRQDVDNIHKFLTDFGFDITGILDQSFRFEGEITQ
jgi:phage baseplate assembly protein W